MHRANHCAQNCNPFLTVWIHPSLKSTKHYHSLQSSFLSLALPVIATFSLFPPTIIHFVLFLIIFWCISVDATEQLLSSNSRELQVTVVA